MAEVQVKEEGGGKNKQKKKHLRVDFTPMVDMNMLLITFFMFCTTLLTPKTMNLNMPSDKEVDKDDSNQVRESTAVTLILGANDEIYYYLGMIDEKGEAYDNPDFLKPTGYGDNGLRQLMLEKNKGTYELIQDLKLKLKNLEIKEEEFYAVQAEIQKDAMKEKKIAPSVMIKPTDFSTYKNMVDALDEMLVCNIGAYTIMDIADGDRHLLYSKTGNLDYLTEDQRVKLAAATVKK